MLVLNPYFGSSSTWVKFVPLMLQIQELYLEIPMPINNFHKWTFPYSLFNDALIIILLNFNLKSVYKTSKLHPKTTDCTLPQIKHIAYLFVCLLYKFNAFSCYPTNTTIQILYGGLMQYCNTAIWWRLNRTAGTCSSIKWNKYKSLYICVCQIIKMKVYMINTHYHLRQ